ncbi:phenylalanine--tRNA ligase subunit alpha [Robiginitomaculum antarcticum]|uniref:phenylalanine--tRNA ligase subunit alpha n=1 Tax=Robiginitomaculum antarcticum TaxID=437507 RepID=UPI00037D26B1|nr:phenylalanine--tRNA ligase subunit alpha [Robiginitomaculum antarcticum]
MSNISAKITSIEPDVKPVKNTTKSTMAALPGDVKRLPKAKSHGVWIAGWLAALLWIGAVGAAYYFANMNGAQTSTATSFEQLSFIALAFIPAALIFAICFLISSFGKLASQTQSLVRAADEISRPDAAAQSRATSLASAVRSQIISVDSELSAAMESLAGMENVLRAHTDALTASHVEAKTQTLTMDERLTEQRTALKSLTGSFDERMASLSNMLTEHNERLSSSTHVAEQKIQEARVSVEGAAAKINASSEIVRSNALSASETLSDSQIKIAKLGEDIRQQAERLGELNSSHADDMKTLLSQLRDEQQEMEASIEDRLSRLRDMSLSAKVSTESLNSASEAGRQTVEALAQSAKLADDAVKKRFADMEDMVRYSNSRAESISDRAAKRVRDSLALTRLEIGRIEDDMHALEARMSRRAAGEPEELVVESRAATGWRKNLLRFRPLTGQSPIEDIEAEETAMTEMASDQSNEGAQDIAPIPRTAPASEPSPAPLSPRPAASASEPEPDIADSIAAIRRTPEPQIKPQSKTQTVVPTDMLDLSPKQEKDPDTLDIAQPEDASQSASPDLTLDIEEHPILSIPDTNADVLSPVISQPALNNLRRKAKAKSGWSWRGFLGGIDNDDNALQPSDTPVLTFDQIKAEIISRLSSIGLSPNSVVDEGCVIEAVNTRRFKGAAEMRNVVTLRLPSEIGYLKKAFATDENFRNQAEDFAQRYYQLLTGGADDRESLRETLQTVEGRAFILCDTALG